MAKWPSYSCQRMMPEAFAISWRRGGDYEDALTIHHAVLVAGGEGEAERGRGGVASDMCPMYLPASYSQDS